MVSGDVTALALFTEDVVGASPLVEVNNREDLRAQLSDRRDGLTEIDVCFDAITGDEPTVVVSWRVAADHTGEILVNEDAFYEPTGRRFRMSVVSHLTFREGRISAFRHEYDADGLRSQLGKDVTEGR
jgi:ketosteroid isomerase-like protein